MITTAEMEELAKCKVYTYNGKKVKSHTHILIVSLIFIFSAILILGFLMFREIIDKGIIALCLIGAFIVMIAYIVKNLQFDAMKALTQYFVDSEGDCYKIQFTKVSAQVIKVKRQYSVVPLISEVLTLIDSLEKLKIKEEYMKEAYADAKDKALGFYYVNRFKQGISDWNWLSGGEAKVILLGKEDEIRIPEDYIV